MAGHLGKAATLNRLMTRFFFWQGIHENVHWWCAACRECQLVNPPGIHKSAIAPSSTYAGPFRENWYGPHQAIRMVGTGASLCISCTLKTMIQKFVHEDANNVSPFELLYGCQPRPVGFWTSWERRGRRDLRRAKKKFTMCWTWEQNSTPWSAEELRFCYRPRTSRAGCTIGEPDYAILHREIKYLYYSPILALNYSPSGKGPWRSHSE